MSSNNEFKQLIKDYIGVDDQLKVFNQEIKHYRDKKKDYEQRITDFMINNNLSRIDIGSSGALKVSKNKPLKKINRKFLTSILLDTLGHDKAEELIEEIYKPDDESDEIIKLERQKKN